MGWVRFRVISADIPYLLRTIEKADIPVHRLKQTDDLTLELQVKHQSEIKLCKLIEKRGAKVTVLERKGVYQKIVSLTRRPVLVGALILLLAAGFYLPTRIFFFRVEGNVSIPERLILEAAEEAGISFGASAKDVRSEKMKNALLEKIPELQWAGINTSGCVATISVKERQAKDDPRSNPTVSSIVATRDGIICDMTVTNGNPICKVGQAVSKGQILISGYLNCAQSILATRSSGEVYAETVHKIDAIMPSNYMRYDVQEKVIQKISIIFRKKRINFGSGSGILDSSCVKMYEENYVTLPGGFQLPVKIVIETWIICQQQPDSVASNEQRLSEITKRYLKDHMVAGAIHSQNEQISVSEEAILLTGKYGCIEMIGREQNEEIIKP